MECQREGECADAGKGEDGDGLVARVALKDDEFMGDEPASAGEEPCSNVHEGWQFVEHG